MTTATAFQIGTLVDINCASSGSLYREILTGPAGRLTNPCRSAGIAQSALASPSTCSACSKRARSARQGSRTRTVCRQVCGRLSGRSYAECGAQRTGQRGRSAP
jgi:hypothetical protein